MALVAILWLAGLPGCDHRANGDRQATEAAREVEALPRLVPHRGPYSADAHPEVTESLQLDLATPSHPSDGGGRAWIASAFAVDRGETRAVPRNSQGEPVFRAGESARFQIVFEAGPLGVAEGGVVFLQVSPFWEWDDPQTEWQEGPGFTRVSSEADGVTLDAFLAASQLLAIEIGGRALTSGERIEIVYGAGARGARVDRYAEREARLWLAVDGDGDGVREPLDASPRVQIVPRSPAWLVTTLPSTARPGDAVRLTLALLDANGNAGIAWPGEVTLESDAGLELPASVRFTADDRGRVTIVGHARRAGTHRVVARALTEAGPIESESNPLVVREGIAEILWADLHGHSQLSDGTGTPEDFYDYARNVAALDVAALTDHDHWGMRFLDARPELWQRIRDAAERFNEPGRFVALLGYEWTSWLQGHRHVLYFSDEGEVLSSLDPRYESPDQLWAALRGKPALTFAHHSAGGPVSTNWSFAPPADLEPVTEIASVHGSSEAADSPGRIYDPVPGNFVRDVLRMGYRFGFIGSSDSHDGHPGLAGIAARGVSGLAAIRAAERTRASVHEALRERRCYATSGARIFLAVTLESPETLQSDDNEQSARSQRLRVEIAAVAGVARVDFVRNGLMASTSVDGERELVIERTIPALAAGEFLYVRVVQEDSGTAWSSPFYGPVE